MVYLKEILHQQFPLPKPVLRYLLINANVKLIKKLQQVCRYFYSKFNFSIIDSLSIVRSDSLEIANFNIRIPYKQIECFRNNLYLNKRLYVSGKSVLTSLCPKIVNCTIYELVIQNCEKFTMNDFDFLTKFGYLKIVKIHCHILNPDDTEASLEDILSYIPNVYHFINDNCILTSNTMNKILALKRNVKFCFLWLEWISEFFDPHFFKIFVKEMFEFENAPIPNPQLMLTGSSNALQQLYNSIKPLRENSLLLDEIFCLIIE